MVIMNAIGARPCYRSSEKLSVGPWSYTEVGGRKSDVGDRTQSGQNVAAGFPGTEAADEAGFDERAEDIEGALLGDADAVPDLARSKGFVVAEKMKELLLFWAENEFHLA